MLIASDYCMSLPFRSLLQCSATIRKVCMTPKSSSNKSQLSKRHIVTLSGRTITSATIHSWALFRVCHGLRHAILCMNWNELENLNPKTTMQQTIYTPCKTPLTICKGWLILWKKIHFPAKRTVHIEKKHHHTLTPYLKMRLHQIAIDLKGRGATTKKRRVRFAFQC